MAFGGIPGPRIRANNEEAAQAVVRIHAHDAELEEAAHERYRRWRAMLAGTVARLFRRGAGRGHGTR